MDIQIFCDADNYFRGLSQVISPVSSSAPQNTDQCDIEGEDEPMSGVKKSRSSLSMARSLTN